MQHASVYAVAAMGFFSTAVGLGSTSVSIFLYIRALPVNEAARRATAALQAFAESGRLIAIQPQVWGRRKASISAATGALPGLLVVVVANVCIFGILAAYRAVQLTAVETLIIAIDRL